jgi:acetolactate synthase-1/2/3 large subunit
MPFYDRLYDYQKEIKHILVRHEQGATHAAQGYARATGRTGVVVVTSGPAATNIITGLADAQMDSTPLVVITGQVASPLLGTDAFQETDVVGITQPITKWAYQIRHARDVAWAVARAFYIASTGRPGPVVLDFTVDAQKEMAEFGYKPCKFIRSYIPRPELNMDVISVAADLINKAERPMILAGHGVMISNAEKCLIDFAEKADIPVGATLLGLSVMPSEHPLYVGMLGMHGNIALNINTNKADLLIAVGMRFDSRITGRVSTYAPNAKVIHIDIDDAELNKIINANVAIHADAGDALRALLPLVNNNCHTEWRLSFEKPWQIEREKVIEREIHPTVDRMLMGEVINKVSEASKNSSIIVTDVGQNQMFSARYSRFTKTRSFISSGGLGTMGFGLPAAIGAKIGVPERTVCLFVGDGGLQMTIQEFGTILEYQVDVKIILLNNNFLGNVRQWQALFFGGRFSQTPMINPDFVALAKAYGIAGEDVAERKDLDAAIERMLTHKGAYLLNVNIDETDMVFPMTPADSNVDYIMLNEIDCYPND